MWRAFLNILKVKELRSRLLFTALIIVLVRVASNIPCPGINPAALERFIQDVTQSSGSEGGLVQLIDLFSGGALAHFALGALGIMPYITASIILQLLVPVIPQLEKMQREGESGRQKITQYTRYLTILVCVVQGIMVALAMVNPAKLHLPQPVEPLYMGSPAVFVPVTVLVITCTTMVFTWLGEQITERGIGNGVSLIITINIVSRLPHSVIELVQMAIKGTTPDGSTFKSVQLLLLLVMFCVVTAATILLSQGYRRVPIQMVRKTVGKQMMGGSTYMPLKVNFANVMPIIFAGAIMMLPSFIFNTMAAKSGGFWMTLATFFQQDGLGYTVTYGLLIVIFSFFWVANQFNPLQIADNLKKEGAYIPGISPGQPTADFLDSAMTRVTAGGALFLLVLAIFPMFLYRNFSIPFMVAQFFGGTSLLIMVGVVLDTMSQLESHLTMRHYEGFLKSGRLRSRGGN
ncbi:MAG: preprotein translocase subunit SecY [Lentisphaeria bacterium]|nr:preprotein translocase subunit SecY [Lentisphaerota bacterium]MBO5990504.1 preprotein translocase subunit SecY [Lentisphaeria bacterium]MBR2633690.1 preprotein translocase subunit SecY [Lentisphaeria bacterium]